MEHMIFCFPDELQVPRALCCNERLLSSRAQADYASNWRSESAHLKASSEDAVWPILQDQTSIARRQATIELPR